jgi:hypothetical protein
MYPQSRDCYRSREVAVGRLASSWQGLGLDGRVNRCELSINVVTKERAKDADRLCPKGMWPGTGASLSSVMDDAPPAEREDLPHPVIQAEHGKPVILPQG